MTLFFIIVFSYSEIYTGGMIQAIDEQKPDQVIHLGDLISDAEEISYLYPKLPVCMVPGNCTLQGRSILLSHGHLWGVKSGCDAAIARARAAGADILLFGHTHQPLCQQMEDGLWVLNPGPSRSSYGTILLEEGLTCCTLTRLL